MKIRTKLILMLFALIVVLVSGCMQEKKTIDVPPGNASSYEFEVFINQTDNQTLKNTTTFYPLENTKRVQVVNAVINTSKIKIYPPDTLGGGAREPPVENLVLLVGPANTTAPTPQVFEEFSRENGTSNVSHNLTEEVSQSMRVINLEFNESVTGFIAYTLKTPGTQSFTFIKPDSEYIRVVLPEGYVTGNRVFGIPRPEPANISFDKNGRQTLLWISSKMGEREEVIQVKYYTETAPLYFLAAIVVLLFGVGIILLRYSRSKKELESVRDVLDLEREYDENQWRKK